MRYHIACIVKAAGYIYAAYFTFFLFGVFPILNIATALDTGTFTWYALVVAGLKLVFSIPLGLIISGFATLIGELIEGA